MQYRYKARNQGGTIVEGVYPAESKQGVVMLLRKNGMIPISISDVDVREKEPLVERLKRISTVSLSDKAVFFRQLATMVDAGVTLTHAMDILAGQTKNGRLAHSIKETKKLVDSGLPLSDAMRRDKVFNLLMISMVQAGEEGGVLDDSLDRLATFIERQDALKKKIVSAVSYPAVVMLFSFFILYLLVTVVVPKFAKVFDGLGVELPFVTRTFFNGALWLSNHGLIVLGVVTGVSFSIWLLNRLQATKPFMDRVKLKLPVVGDIIFKAIMARANRTFSALVEAGVPILNALEMTASVAGNDVVAKSFLYLRDSARRGASLGDSAKETKVFPPMVAHMLAVGEQTGRLDHMLAKVADWFELELDEKIKRLTSILEPVLIMFVGGVVALVAFAVFMPIVGAIQALI